jgi:hypothetical protein
MYVILKIIRHPENLFRPISFHIRYAGLGNEVICVAKVARNLCCVKPCAFRRSVHRGLIIHRMIMHLYRKVGYRRRHKCLIKIVNLVNVVK